MTGRDSARRKAEQYRNDYLSTGSANDQIRAENSVALVRRTPAGHRSWFWREYVALGLDIRSYVDTAREHGQDVLTVLRNVMTGAVWRSLESAGTSP